MKKLFLIAAFFFLECGALFGEIKSIIITNNSKRPLKLRYTLEGGNSETRRAMRPGATVTLPYGTLLKSIDFWEHNTPISSASPAYNLNPDIEAAVGTTEKSSQSMNAEVSITRSGAGWNVIVSTKPTDFSLATDVSQEAILADPIRLLCTDTDKNTEYFLNLSDDSEEWGCVFRYKNTIYANLSAEEFSNKYKQVMNSLDALEKKSSEEKHDTLDRLKTKLEGVKRFKTAPKAKLVVEKIKLVLFNNSGTPVTVKGLFSSALSNVLRPGDRITLPFDERQYTFFTIVSKSNKQLFQGSQLVGYTREAAPRGYIVVTVNKGDSVSVNLMDKKDFEATIAAGAR